jgi:hypothetical protein
MKNDALPRQARDKHEEKAKKEKEKKKMMKKKIKMKNQKKNQKQVETAAFRTRRDRPSVPAGRPQDPPHRSADRGSMCCCNHGPAPQAHLLACAIDPRPGAENASLFLEWFPYV